MSLEEEKAAAAEAAVDMIPSDARVIGLGSGSTVAHFVRSAAKRPALRDLTYVPSSSQIMDEALGAGLRVIDVDEVEWVDLTVDGADEITPGGTLLKGGGGALTREKVLAVNSDFYLIIADHTKLVGAICETRPLPVEILSFGSSKTVKLLEEMTGWRASLREVGGRPFVTDNGQLIVDLHPPDPLEDPESVYTNLKLAPGVLEVGIFLELADEAVIARGDLVEVLTFSA